MASYAEMGLVRSLAWLANSQAAISNNIANATTLGYKRRLPVATPMGADFHSMLGQALPSIGYQ
jgi:flagellar basal body rod protein FlgB